MAIVKNFHIKVRLASFCCVNVIKYSMRPQQCACIYRRMFLSYVVILDDLGTFCENIFVARHTVTYLDCPNLPDYA